MFSKVSPLKKKYAKIDPGGKEDATEQIKLSNYLAHDVNPILKSCIIFLLCNKPRDVLDIMIGYLKQASAQQLDPGNVAEYTMPADAASSADSQKKYFNGSINPILRKLIREVTIHRPKPENIARFMCDELVRIQRGESSVVVDKTFNFSSKLEKDTSRRASTTDEISPPRQDSGVGKLDLSAGKRNDSGHLLGQEDGSEGSCRPHTTGRFLSVPDFVAPTVSADGRIEDVMYFGGKLQIRILHAEKYSGSGSVFGMGRYASSVHVMCGDTLITKAVVSAGALNDEGHWAGYEADFGIMVLTPNLGSCVDLVVYDCEREKACKPLGTAKLIVDSITKKANFECVLPIENNLSPLAEAAGEAPSMNPDTLEGDSLDIDSLICVGQITLSVTFDPYAEYSLEPLMEDVIDVKLIRSMGFRFGWEPKEVGDGMPLETRRRYVNDRFSAALCVFDADGFFLDGVDTLQKYTRKGPRTYYRRLTGEQTAGKDVDEIIVQVKHKSARYDTNKCFLYFLMLMAKDGASLNELRSAYIRVVDGHSNVPYGRFDVDMRKQLHGIPGEDPTAIILARVWRNFHNPLEWIVKPYGTIEHRKHRFGMLIPSLKNNLGADLLPGCQGTEDDCIAFVTQGEVIDLSTVRVNKLSFGANWDPVDGLSIDLDLGCLMLDAEKNVADFVSFRHLVSSCGSVSHGGDARDDLGGDGDDEQIHISVNEIPPNIHFIAFFITCFDGKPLQYIDTCSGHLFESESKRDLVMCDCVDEDVKKHTAVLLCILFRTKDRWAFLNASVCSDGEELHDNLPTLQKFMQENSVIQAHLGAIQS